MPVNPVRRTALADAAIDVLAAEGARGLTHRAVDRAAGAPAGTTSNYFRTRAALFSALAQRIYERLSPAAELLSRPDAVPASRARLHELIADIVDRVTRDPAVTVALLELRLEATRRPEIQADLTAFLRTQFDGDLAFNRAAGLDGDEDEIVLLHLAIDGLILDQLTTPGALPIGDRAARIAQIVDRLVPPDQAPGAQSAG